MVDLASPDIRRLTVDEVRAMYDSGVLAEDERVELEDGVLVRMTPIGAGHSWSLKWLTKRFAVASVDAAWEVVIQDQLNFPGGYRHPDVLVTPLLPYGEQPETALLIIEVADSSRRRDRDKALRYAQIAVDEYWIVDLSADLVVVYREPGPDGYALVTEARRGALLEAVAVPGGPVIDVAEILGPESPAAPAA